MFRAQLQKCQCHRREGLSPLRDDPIVSVSDRREYLPMQLLLNRFRPLEQRSIISFSSFVDLLEYVNNLKKRSNSRPNSMTSAGSKMDGERSA